MTPEIIATKLGITVEEVFNRAFVEYHQRLSPRAVAMALYMYRNNGSMMGWLNIYMRAVSTRAAVS